MKRNGLIGKKVGMTRVFTENGDTVPVTIVYVEKQAIVEKKSIEKDGYESVKVAFEKGKKSKIKEPVKGILAKAGLEQEYKKFIEFKGEKLNSLEVGTVYGVEQLEGVETVNVVGLTKGRGFAGAIKRHNFQRGPEAHGSKTTRLLGSIGQCSYPGSVFKGKRMPGHYGDSQVTIKNLKVIDVIKEENIVLVKGALPGPNGQNLILTIR